MNSVATASPLPDTRERGWLTPLELGAARRDLGRLVPVHARGRRDFGAMPLVEVRLALGSLVLLPFLWRARAQFPAKLWPKLAIIGAINSAVPFMLFAWAAQRAPAGIGAIANAMTVLFTALVGFLFFGEKIGSRRVMALLVGFAGVVVLASGKTAGASIGWAVAAGAAAAFLYGIGTQPGAPAPDRPAAGGGRLGHARRFGAADAAVRDRAVAGACDPGEVLVLRRACSACCARALAFVMYYRLIARIGAEPRFHGDLPGPAVRRGVGLAAAGRAADRDDGHRRRADPGQRGAEPAHREVT